MEENNKIQKIVTLDIDGTHIKSALIEKNQNQINIKNYKEKETPKDKEKFIDALVLSIKESFRYNETSFIGISCPGPLTEEEIINPPNLPLKNFKLKKFLEKKFKVKVKIENNANCAALAESKQGIERKTSVNNLVTITLGTGVGSGLIIDNKLYKGQGFAGEIGHILLGNKYLEEVSSGKYLKKLTKEKLGREMEIKDLLDLRTEEADKILNQITENLTNAIGTIINILNPDAIVLAGGFQEAGNRLLKLINIKIQKYIFVPTKTKIIWTKIENPGIIGAGLL